MSIPIRRRLEIITTTVVLLLVSGGFRAQADEQPGALFVEAAPDLPGEVGQRIGMAPVTRLRSVTLNAGALPTASSKVGDVLVFNLFDDITLRGVLEAKLRDGAGACTWTGGIEGEFEGGFTWVLKDGVAVANIRSPQHGSFQLRSSGNARYTVRQVNEARYPGCGNETVHGELPMRIGARAVSRGTAFGPRRKARAPTVMRVMVVYTPTARERLGGTAAADAEIVLAVDEANEAFLASGIDARLALVHSQEVPYTELGSWTGWDLFMLTMGWGSLQQVHYLRNWHRADLVTLLTDARDVCGQGWVPPWPAAYFSFLGYNIVSWSCASGNFTFAHEVGHNLGCLHDRENNDWFSLFPYGYGYRFTGDDGVLYRSVMAYSPGRRTPHFSNPSVLYQGVPTGVPLTDSEPCDNAKIIRDAVPAVSAYRL